MTDEKPVKIAPLNEAADKLGDIPPALGSNTPKIAMHDLLGQKLREYYDQISSEPVPDRFDQLLKDLDTKSRTPAPKPSATRRP